MTEITRERDVRHTDRKQHNPSKQKSSHLLTITSSDVWIRLPLINRDAADEQRNEPAAVKRAPAERVDPDFSIRKRGRALVEHAERQPGSGARRAGG